MSIYRYGNNDLSILNVKDHLGLLETSNIDLLSFNNHYGITYSQFSDGVNIFPQDIYTVENIYVKTYYNSDNTRYCYTTKDGSAYHYGELDITEISDELRVKSLEQFTGIADDVKIIKIDFCENFTIVLQNNGMIKVYGVIEESMKTIIEDEADIVDIACGKDHVLVLNKSGDVFSIGDNTYGQLGIDNTNNFVNNFQKVDIDVAIIEVFCGKFYSACLSYDRVLYVFGDNTNNKLGLTSSLVVDTPTQLTYSSELITKILNVYCHLDHILLSTYDSLYITNISQHMYEVIILNNDNNINHINIKKFFLFDNYIFFLHRNGKLYKQTKNISNIYRFDQAPLFNKIADNVLKVDHDNDFIYILNKRRQFLRINANNIIEPITNKVSFNLQLDTYIPQNIDIRFTITESLIVGGEHLIFIDEIFKLNAYLNNQEISWKVHNVNRTFNLINCIGKVDIKNTQQTIFPIDFDNISVVDVSVGYYFTIFVLENGYVLSSGYNTDNGVLGIGKTNRDGGILVQTNINDGNYYYEALNITDAVSCASGIEHTLVLTKDGNVYGFGNNAFGQLLNDTTEKIFPVLLDFGIGDIVVQKIFCGSYNTFIIDQYDDCYSFGNNSHYQLGHNSTNILGKVPIGNVKKVFPSDSFTFFITNDNLIYCVGDNQYGQLCIGNTIDQDFPVKNTQEELVYVIHISPSKKYTLFLIYNGDIYISGELNGVQYTNPTPLLNPNNTSKILQANFIASNEYYSYIVDFNRNIYMLEDNSTEGVIYGRIDLSQQALSVFGQFEKKTYATYVYGDYEFEYDSITNLSYLADNNDEISQIEKGDTTNYPLGFVKRCFFLEKSNTKLIIVTQCQIVYYEILTQRSNRLFLLDETSFTSQLFDVTYSFDNDDQNSGTIFLLKELKIETISFAINTNGIVFGEKKTIQLDTIFQDYISNGNNDLINLITETQRESYQFSNLDFHCNSFEYCNGGLYVHLTYFKTIIKIDFDDKLDISSFSVFFKSNIIINLDKFDGNIDKIKTYLKDNAFKPFNYYYDNDDTLPPNPILRSNGADLIVHARSGIEIKYVENDEEKSTPYSFPVCFIFFNFEVNTNSNRFFTGSPSVLEKIRYIDVDDTHIYKMANVNEVIGRRLQITKHNINDLNEINFVTELRSRYLHFTENEFLQSVKKGDYNLIQYDDYYINEYLGVIHKVPNKDEYIFNTQIISNDNNYKPGYTFLMKINIINNSLDIQVEDLQIEFINNSFNTNLQIKEKEPFYIDIEISKGGKEIGYFRYIEHNFTSNYEIQKETQFDGFYRLEFEAPSFVHNNTNANQIELIVFVEQIINFNDTFIKTNTSKIFEYTVQENIITSTITISNIQDDNGGIIWDIIDKSSEFFLKNSLQDRYNLIYNKDRYISTIIIENSIFNKGFIIPLMDYDSNFKYLNIEQLADGSIIDIILKNCSVYGINGDGADAREQVNIGGNGHDAIKSLLDCVNIIPDTNTVIVGGAGGGNSGPKEEDIYILTKDDIYTIVGINTQDIINININHLLPRLKFYYDSGDDDYIEFSQTVRINIDEDINLIIDSVKYTIKNHRNGLGGNNGSGINGIDGSTSEDFTLNINDYCQNEHREYYLKNENSTNFIINEIMFGDSKVGSDFLVSHENIRALNLEPKFNFYLGILINIEDEVDRYKVMIKIKILVRVNIKPANIDDIDFYEDFASDKTDSLLFQNHYFLMNLENNDNIIEHYIDKSSIPGGNILQLSNSNTGNSGLAINYSNGSSNQDVDIYPTS